MFQTQTHNCRWLVLGKTFVFCRAKDSTGLGRLKHCLLIHTIAFLLWKGAQSENKAAALNAENFLGFAVGKKGISAFHAQHAHSDSLFILHAVPQVVSKGYYRLKIIFHDRPAGGSTKENLNVRETWA